MRGLDGQERQGCRTGRHHHAALLQGSSGTGDNVEGLRRAAGEVTRHVFSSLNLAATSSVMASSAACACGPAAETTIDVPGPAESIINPMIDVPPTVSWPFVTQMSASKRSTIWTNLADARA